MELTPKERAKELVDKYFENWNLSLTIENAKQCTLIAVDEILSIQCLSNGYAESCKHMKPHKGQRPYWEEVKQEINNL
jgi:hypothetical protein